MSAACLYADLHRSDAYRDWADLPVDIVVSIGTKSSLADYVRLSAACKRWLSASMSDEGFRRLKALRQKPYLFLPADSENDQESCSLLDIFNDFRYSFGPLPQVRGKFCVGSQSGWLALIDQIEGNPSLFNPFTGSYIPLPEITTLSQLRITYDEGLKYNYERNHHVFSLPAKLFPYGGIKKIVTSSDPAKGNFTAVALFSRYWNLIYTRPGDRKWTLLEWEKLMDTRPCYVDDVIYHDGKFIMVSRIGEIYALDFNSPFVQVTKMPAPPVQWDAWKHLVIFSGTLLRLDGISSAGFFRDAGETKRCVIWRVDDKQAECVQLTSLDGHCIFLGGCMSFSIAEFDGSGTDRLYFSDCLGDYCNEEMRHRKHRRIGFYNMEDASIKTIDHLVKQWPLPIWIVPSGH